jgi:hypothetical protein
MCESVGEQAAALALPQAQSRAQAIRSSNWGARNIGQFGSNVATDSSYLCKSGAFSGFTRIV